MFRELRRSREDPEVLAAKSEKQYAKVLNNIVWSFLVSQESCKSYPLPLRALWH